MKDIYFIQYYRKTPWYNDLLINNFHNGFSQTYNNLKDKGDFIWLSENEEIPIDKGEIYISLLFADVMPKLFEKSIQNPNLKIHLGGPAFVKYGCELDIENLYIHKNLTVEELFNLKYDETAWNLEIPNGFNNVGYSVSIQNNAYCYWGKCTYCKCQNIPKDYSIIHRTNIPIIEYDADKYIWINTSCITPNNIEDIYLNLPNRNDVYYGTYARADKRTLNTLKKNLPLMKVDTHHLAFSIGIEVPCNRILKYLNKGTNIKIYKDILTLLNKYNCILHLYLMLGFNNFTWDDVKEIEDFFEEIKTKIDLSKMTTTLNRLMILEDRPIYQNPPGEITEYNIWYSYLKAPKIYKCILNDEQKEINNYLRNYYHSLGFKKFHDCYDKTYNKKE